MRKILITLLLITTIASSNTQSQWVGQTAPSFDLPDQHGKFHNLNEYNGQWLVLYFYPKDDTSGCTTEAKNFTTSYKSIKNLGAIVVGISLDDIESHKAFAEKYDIPYTLLADKDEVMSTSYGVIKNIPLMHYAKRQTFIINPKGVVAKFYEDVNASTHSTEVIEDLKNLKVKYESSLGDFSKN